MSHTKGPWVVGDWVGEQCPINGADWDELATVYGCDDGIDERVKQGRANARLIAAAPELLEACKALWAAQTQTKPAISRHEAISMAFAAIAKAEGK